MYKITVAKSAIRLFSAVLVVPKNLNIKTENPLTTSVGTKFRDFSANIQIKKLARKKTTKIYSVDVTVVSTSEAMFSARYLESKRGWHSPFFFLIIQCCLIISILILYTRCVFLILIHSGGIDTRVLWD